MRYVLVIPGWFPSRVAFLAGDFIERHARAASLYFPVKVLYVVKDNSLPFGKIEAEHRKLSDNYECFIWYYSSRNAVTLFERMASAWLQSKCLARGFRDICKTYGQPSLLHAHVLLKHAWFALRQSRKTGIPLLASEQWTGYLPEATGEFQSISNFQQRAIRKVLAHAVHVTTVSEYLAQQMRKRFSFADHTVIPNLVDTSVFKPATTADSVTTFIHISTLSYQKNFGEILEACKRIRDSQWRMLVVAPADPAYEADVKAAGLSEQIIFKKEVPQSELCTMVAAADALLLYSRYETFGCVIVEANACGVPVIVSDFPVFDENVMEGVTGFKVALHDPAALADRMQKIINKDHGFHKEQIISITRAKYSEKVVGKQFADVYDQYAKP